MDTSRYSVDELDQMENEDAIARYAYGHCLLCHRLLGDEEGSETHRKCEQYEAAMASEQFEAWVASHEDAFA